MMKADLRLDATGLARPLAAVRARKALDTMESGQVLLVESAPPGMPEDMEYYASRAGHGIVGVEEEEGRTHIYIRKG